MFPQSMFEQKYRNSQRNSTENSPFCSGEKSLYVAWACFRNAASWRENSEQLRVIPRCSGNLHQGLRKLNFAV